MRDKAREYEGEMGLYYMGSIQLFKLCHLYDNARPQTQFPTSIFPIFFTFCFPLYGLIFIRLTNYNENLPENIDTVFAVGKKMPK